MLAIEKHPLFLLFLMCLLYISWSFGAVSAEIKRMKRNILQTHHQICLAINFPTPFLIPLNNISYLLAFEQYMNNFLAFGHLEMNCFCLCCGQHEMKIYYFRLNLSKISYVASTHMLPLENKNWTLDEDDVKLILMNFF